MIYLHNSAAPISTFIQRKSNNYDVWSMNHEDIEHRETMADSFEGLPVNTERTPKSTKSHLQLSELVKLILYRWLSLALHYC